MRTVGSSGIRVALLRDQLPANFGGGEPRIQPLRAKLGVGLALSIHNGPDIGEQGGQVIFSRLASAEPDGIQTGEPMRQFLHPLANRRTVPAQRLFGPREATVPQCLDRLGHKAAPCRPFQRPRRLDQDGLERVGQFHGSCSSLLSPAMVSPFWMFYFFRFPSVFSAKAPVLPEIRVDITNLIRYPMAHLLCF